MDRDLTIYLSRPNGIDVIALAVQTGASLEYPDSTGEVMILDHEGNDSQIPIEEFSKLLRNDVFTPTFKTWFSSSEDMVVTIRRRVPSHPSMDTVTYFLDGLDDDRVEHVVAVLQGCLMSIRDTIVGYVQVYNQSADVDWAAFMSAPTSPPRWRPDLLVLSTRFEADTSWGIWEMNSPARGLMTLVDVI